MNARSLKKCPFFSSSLPHFPLSSFPLLIHSYVEKYSLLAPVVPMCHCRSRHLLPLPTPAACARVLLLPSQPYPRSRGCGNDWTLTPGILPRKGEREYGETVASGEYPSMCRRRTCSVARQLVQTRTTEGILDSDWVVVNQNGFAKVRALLRWIEGFRETGSSSESRVYLRRCC